MPKTGKRKSRDDDDDDWDPNGKSKKICKKKNNQEGEACFIHCSESNEKMTKVPSLESWQKLLKAAKIRKDEKVIQLASSFNDDENGYPIIYYHLKCRNKYTHKGTMDADQK